MLAVLDWLKIGAGAAMGIGLSVLVYEGIPLGPLRSVPLIGPALEFVADGRVDRERRAADAEGYARAQMENRQASFDQIKERMESDVEVRDMGDAELCGLLGGVFADDGTCN